MLDPRDKQAFLQATPAQREVVRHHLHLVLCVLRAQYLSYQTSHWQVCGDTYYGNHLLFQRLYESVEDQIDRLAEKMVAYLGTESVDLKMQVLGIAAFLGPWSEVACHHERGLTSETALQEAVKMAYEAIKDSGAMTLGLDDWLMATANAHEENEYLLQQVLRKPGRVASDEEWLAEIEQSRLASLKWEGPEGSLGWHAGRKQFNICLSDLPRGASLQQGLVVKTADASHHFRGAEPIREGGKLNHWKLAGDEGYTLLVWND